MKSINRAFFAPVRRWAVLTATISIAAAGLAGAAPAHAQTSGDDVSAPASSGSTSPPTISGSPPAVAPAGQFYVFMPTASESTPRASLSFSVTNLPSWAAFSTSTGTLSGIVPLGTTGSDSNITITVTNSKGQSASLKPFTIQVQSSSSGQAAALAFVLTSPYDSTQNFSSYFSNPSLDGAALQVPWSNLETAPGKYIWSNAVSNALDNVIAEAKTAGKKITLHMAAGPSSVPSWLASAGAQFYSSGGRSYVVPWDPVYLSQYSTFILALAGHLAAKGYTSTIYDVSLTVPEAEMNIIPCSNGMLGSTLYSSVAYLAAWATVGAALELSFPSQKKFISPPGGEAICGTATDPTFYSDLLSTLLLASGSYWMFAADLNAATTNAEAGSGRANPYLSTFLGTTGVGFQMFGAATSGSGSKLGGTYPGNLQQAVCAGLASGGQYIEIYSKDVLNSNTTIQTAIQSVHKPSLCNF